jgi:hypothetical protein
VAIKSVKITQKSCDKKIQSPQTLTSKTPNNTLTEEQIDKLVMQNANILKKLADR